MLASLDFNLTCEFGKNVPLHINDLFLLLFKPLNMRGKKAEPSYTYLSGNI